MIKYISCLFFLCLGILSAQPNFNLELVSNAPIGEAVNDVWGYVAEDGTEYAIIGSQTKTTIFSLLDPANPVEIGSVSGSSSTWRDIKSWKDHLYVVADSGNDGLLIIDMSTAPDSISHVFWQPVLTVAPDTAQLDRCHNIYIDENGFAYLAGCRVMSNRDRRGAIILDLNQDPKNPVHVGSETRAYAHDLFTRDNIMYASEIYNGEIAMYDVSDKSNPTFIASAPTSSNFTHNAWISDDSKYVFTTDEVANASIDAFDISDPADIRLLDKFKPLETIDRGVIPHNTHYYNGFLVTSWYTDGVVITDATRPENLIKVGAYDTYSGGDGGFSGCWGAYPFLPSGLILASDRQTGLYVFNPDYKRACYLEGTVTDSKTSASINGATVKILAEQENEGTSDATGRYQSGIATAGTYTVKFSHPDYKSIELEAILDNGNITILDAQLEPIEELTVNIRVVDASTQEGIHNAQLFLFNEERTNSAVTDSSGTSTFVITSEVYSIIAGSWGFRQKSGIVFDPALDNLLTIELERGYEDDFILDLGWQVEGNATTGSWTRAIPNGTIDPDDSNVFANVNMDDSSDIGDMCFMTGNNGGNAGDDDVDNGITLLKSAPIFIDTTDEIATIQYRIWYYVGGGGGDPFNDTLNVYINDGVNRILIDSYTSRTNGWTDEVNIPLWGLPINYANGFSVEFEAMDQDPGHLVEAALDVFRVNIELILSDDDVLLSDVQLYPNPFRQILNVDLNEENFNQIEIFDLMGRKVYSQVVQDNKFSLQPQLNAGIYSVVLTDNSGKKLTKLVVSQ